MRLVVVRLFFFANLFAGSAVPLLADLLVGQIYALHFVDVDGNNLSTADGRVTVVVLTTQSDIDKAHAVGDRVPEYCLGNPNYRLITVVNFQKRRSRPIRLILSALVRRRLDGEAQRLQPRYAAKKIAHDPRRDVFAVADFDGSLVSQLGGRFEAGDFHVLVFDRNGELLKQWNDVPSADELAAVVR